MGQETDSSKGSLTQRKNGKSSQQSDSSSGNCDSEADSDSSCEGQSSGFNSRESAKSKLSRKSVSRPKRELLVKRTSSRLDIDSNGSSRSRAGSAYSKVSKISKASSKRKLTKKKKTVRIKERIRGKENSPQEQEQKEETEQDESFPQATEETVNLDENGDFRGYQGKLVEWSNKNQYGRFNILLGEGAFKKVYLAYDTKNGIEVAWNCVKVKGMKSSQKKRIVQEMKILHNLSHKSIMKFYNSWIDKKEGNIVFITEAMHSGTLSEFVKSRPVRIRIVKRWCRHILKALEYLHEEHDPAVIHRDLKLCNIFVSGSSGEIRIGDLGLASWERQGDAKSILGTPEYMAPDMFEASYDEKIDIYAFGLCVLEMVGKEIPYSECTSAPQIYKKVMSSKPPDIYDNIKEGVFKQFIALCIVKDERRITEKNKSGRPAASELLKHKFLVKIKDNPDDDCIADTLLIKPLEDSSGMEEKQPMPKPNSKLQSTNHGSTLQQKNSSSSVKSAQSDKKSVDSLASKISHGDFVHEKEITLDTPTLPSSTNHDRSEEEEESETKSVVKPLNVSDAEEEFNKAEGILKEKEKDSQKQPEKQVEFGDHQVKVIHPGEPPVQVAAAVSNISDVTHTAEPEKKEDESITEDLPINFKPKSSYWIVNASNTKDFCNVSEEGTVTFSSLLNLEFKKESKSVLVEFNSENGNDEDKAFVILTLLNLKTTEKEFKKMAENLHKIRETYQAFKADFIKEYEQDKEKRPEKFEVTLVFFIEEQEGEVISSELPPAVIPNLPEKNVVKFDEVVDEVVNPEIVINVEKVDDVEQILKVDEPEVKEVSAGEIIETDETSKFPFINESNENFERKESIRLLELLKEKISSTLKDTLALSKLNNKKILKLGDGLLKELTIDDEKQSMEIKVNTIDGVDLEKVEHLVLQLSTPTPDPNELQTVKSTRNLRKHSTADLSQNSHSDLSSSINYDTNNNSTNSLLDIEKKQQVIKDPFKILEKVAVTPEKETNFDSLFPPEPTPEEKK